MSLHGGRWTRESRLTNAVIDEALARDGALVMALDIRMPPAARYPDCVADINFAIRWLKRHAREQGVAADNVGGIGTSSGGHQIMLSAMRPRDPRYAAIPLPGDASLAFAIACWPVLDPLARYEMAKAKGMDDHVAAHHAYWPRRRGPGRRQSADDPRPRRAPWSLPPALIIQGTADMILPDGMADRFAAAYRKAGGRVDLRKFDGQPHTFITKDPGIGGIDRRARADQGLRAGDDDVERIATILSENRFPGSCSMNNADLIVATLKAAGISRGFGIPSGNVLPLMEAMRKGGVDFVLTAHEGSAGFAADVTGRMTGAPGLCIATLGPGATNLATGVGNAWLDRSPMIAITCNLNTDQLGRRIQMWIDHHALFKPITKASFRLEKGKIAETVKEAIRIAMSEPRGPVHLDLPEDVALAPVRSDAAAMKALGRIAPAPDGAVAKAGELIAQAKRPIAVLGSTAMRLANPDLLRQVVERHNLPFATTTMAKGMIDEDHPLSLGCIERACRQVQRKFLRSADLIVGLGYDTVEVEYEAWIGDMPLLQIDIDPVDIASSVQLAHQVTGDLDASLTRLAAMPAATNTWPADAVAKHRDQFQAALRPAGAGFHRACRHRCRASRAAARGHPVLRRRRAHPPDREPVGRRMRRRPSSSPTAGRPWASGCRARSRPSSRGLTCRWSA